MELNETKAIVGVPTPGSYSLYNYFSNVHPILSIIIEIENYKINFAYFYLNLSWLLKYITLRLHNNDN